MAESNATTPYAIRPAEPGDAPFILGTWLQQAFRETPWGRRVRAHEFFEGHRPIVVRILERARCLIACDRTDPTTIAGYLVHEARSVGPVVHFVYVKKAYRRLGIARALVTAAELPPDLAGVRITHGTFLWFKHRDDPGLESRFPLAIHDPYQALGIEAPTPRSDECA